MGEADAADIDEYPDEDLMTMTYKPILGKLPRINRTGDLWTIVRERINELAKQKEDKAVMGLGKTGLKQKLQGWWNKLLNVTRKCRPGRDKQSEEVDQAEPDDKEEPNRNAERKTYRKKREVAAENNRLDKNKSRIFKSTRDIASKLKSKFDRTAKLISNLNITSKLKSKLHLTRSDFIRNWIQSVKTKVRTLKTVWRPNNLYSTYLNELGYSMPPSQKGTQAPPSFKDTGQSSVESSSNDTQQYKPYLTMMEKRTRRYRKYRDIYYKMHPTKEYSTRSRPF